MSTGMLHFPVYRYNRVIVGAFWGARERWRWSGVECLHQAGVPAGVVAIADLLEETGVSSVLPSFFARNSTSSHQTSTLLAEKRLVHARGWRVREPERCDRLGQQTAP